MKILVVDDMKLYREIITASLTELGHEVTAVTNGEEAIDSFNQQRPDLIILDVVMPRMDGFECASKIRAIDTDGWIPIIFLSGAVEDKDIARGIEAGGDDYLTKPFNQITMAAKICALQRIVDMRQKLLETMRQLKILSTTDTLTGIYNRWQFDRFINEKIANSSEKNDMFALFFLDVDNFKSINDNFGHIVGDLLLKEICKRLHACLSSGDFLARLGGDEFAIILNDIHTISDSSALAEKIIHLFSEPFEINGHKLRASTSIGIACFPDEGENKESLIQNADIAMYYAKNLGRNNYQYHRMEQNQNYRKKITLESSLKFALDKNEFYIEYQPIYNLKTLEIVNTEALLRWNSPEHGIIYPQIFIPLAEESSLIGQIGSWCFKEACMQRMKWYAAGYKNFKISVNVSPMQLLNKNFIELILKSLSETKIPPSLLEVELTETSLVNYSSNVIDAINDLNNIGINLVIDDFGTGYSSLSNLLQFEFYGLKIDKTFVSGLPDNYASIVLVQNIIDLGKNLKMSVVAEGIETKEQLNFLIDKGCQFGQGYFLARPTGADDFAKILRAKKMKSKV